MRRLVTFLLPLIAAACTNSGALRSTPIYSPPAESIVLRVEVIGVESTDWSPSCGDEKDCIPVHFWYRYRARIREVVSGSWLKPDVEFAHLQHAEYIPAVTKDCYVIVSPASADFSSKIGAAFVADRLLSGFWKNDRAAIKALQNGLPYPGR